MTTGNLLLTRCANRLIEYKNTAPEQARMLDHLNSERVDLEVAIETISEDYLLVTKDFDTVVSRSPNVYTIKTVGTTPGDIDADDFNKFRYMEVVVSDASSDYRRIQPFDHIAQKGDRRYYDAFVLSPGAVVNVGEPQRYLARDNEIQLFPVSDTVYTVRLWYVRHLPEIAATDDVLDFPPALEEALVWGSCKRERLFRRDTVGEFDSEYERARERGLVAIEDRIVDGPTQIQYIADRFSPMV